MGDFENQQRDEIFSKAVRAGKRTYFFDVKATRANEYYITITESKKRFNQEDGKFFYEKHKLFLYKEDFEKFENGLRDVVDFIEAGRSSENEEEKIPANTEKPIEKEEIKSESEDMNNSEYTVDFEDLSSE